MAKTPAPFAAFEWMIAWRYLRARRAEGGVSVMTVISLVGITLAVFALIVTLAVRSGFRAEFVGTILGSNAHVTVYNMGEIQDTGQIDRTIKDYTEMAARVAKIEGVTRVAPLVRAQASSEICSTGNIAFLGPAPPHAFVLLARMNARHPHCSSRC